MVRIALPLLMVVSAVAACSGTTAVLPKNPAASADAIDPATESNRPQPATITVTANGVDPAEVSVTVGARVTFVNQDSRVHEILGGLDHVDRDCLEVDAVGTLAPGQSRQTRVFERARTCNFHDYVNLGNAAFQGRINIR